MRKSLVILISTFVLFGCGANSILSGSKYQPGKNDVVDIHGNIDNLHMMDKFINDFQNMRKSEIRIVRYTIEGDPILTDLKYDKKTINYTFDTTRDQYGNGSITTKQCQNIEKNETNVEMTYSLQCKGDLEDNSILYINYDSSKEDYFGFHLKYGVNMKNEVNTKAEKLVKDLQNGETVVVNDFRFSTEELNKIYKSMKLASFLESKDLKTSCNKEPYQSYEITIWINDAEKRYKWTECDRSKDGVKMKQIVQEIIEVLQQNNTYKSLPETMGYYE
ncbi:DUF4362 domain-containing protein [Metabacillus fastidiosus]|uniref:DUF4362 domain-containing protein n=1 Tax=Metabacillus fastidiosus TaxID=1458 RepID=UPI002E1FA8AF|nr:DUF4362 domain-containing protein [Metabacillus fastidiosus]